MATGLVRHFDACMWWLEVAGCVNNSKNRMLLLFQYFWQSIFGRRSGTFQFSAECGGKERCKTSFVRSLKE